jgi:ferredoxin
MTQTNPLKKTNPITPAVGKTQKNSGQTVVVDQNTCIGCGVCAALCPSVYKMSPEDGKSHVISGCDHNDLCAQEGCDACPVNAITIINE